MKPQNPHSKDMEQALLAAAENLFLERGFARTSTVEIAKRAGCNQTLVHYYFRSKEKLFQQIFAQKFASILQGLVTVDDLDQPFAETIARIAERHFDLLQANPRVPFLILDELIRNPSRIEAIRKSVLEIVPLAAIKQLDQRLKEEIAAGRVRNMTLIDLTMTMASLNVLLFVARPILIKALGLKQEDYAALIERRRHENIEILMRSLTP